MKCEGCGRNMVYTGEGDVVFRKDGVEKHYCLWCACGLILNCILTDKTDVGSRGRKLLRAGLDDYEKKHGGL